MKILLTGATGYLGESLLRGLLEAGHQVTALSRRPPKSETPRLAWIQHDLAAGAPPEDLIHQHRVVLHAAALVKTWVRDRSEFDRINVEAYEQLLARCHHLGVSKVLVTSSFLSLGPSPTATPISEQDRHPRRTFLTDYERTKHLADQVTDRWSAKGLPISTLYPTVLYGAGGTTDGNLVGKMIYWIKTGVFPGIFGNGEQVWNYAYLPDVVRGHVLALDRALPGQRYVLGGENLSLNDVVGRIYTALGRRGRPRHLPVGLAEFLGGCLERWAELSGQTPELTRGVASVYRHHWSYSSETAERALGYGRTSFDDGLAKTVEWVRTLRKWGSA